MHNLYRSSLRAISASLVMILAFAMTGCFQNDGYIGVYFGSWVFEDITVDGEPLVNPATGEEYNHHLMISFQSSFFEIATAGGGDGIQGIWEENGNTIQLHGAEETASARYPDPENPEATIGEFPWQLGFGHSLIEVLDIVSKSKKRMVWTHVDEQGRLWRYSLRKCL